MTAAEPATEPASGAAGTARASRPSIAEVIEAAKRRGEPLVKADPTRRVRVVWNSTAGHKAGVPTNRSDETTLRDLMAKYGLGDDLVATASEEEAVRAVDEAKERGYDTVVAAGGDGTVGCVAGRLLHTDTALGVLPLGSVMNVARQLGIPRDLEVAAAVIAFGEYRRMDVGFTGDHLFLESAAIGMNAAVFSQLGKVDRGQWSALPRAFMQAFRYRPARMRIHLDEGLVEHRSLMVTVSIGPYNGPGMTVAPNARLDDGCFDVTVFRHYSKLELIRHLASIAFGRHAYSPHTRVYRSSAVRIEGDRPLPARADGEDVGWTPLEFRVAPQALKVAAPKALEQQRD